MNSRRRKQVYLAVGVAVLAVGVIIVALLTRGDTSTDQAVSTVTTAPSLDNSTTLTQKEADDLKEALNSKDKAKQAAVLIPELRSGEWSAAELATITEIPISTFQASGDYGRVDAKIGKKIFIIHLTRQTGRWLVFMTEEVR